MTNPLVWLALSFLLVCISLTAVLVVLIPTVVELSRAARSLEKLCDMLHRELPSTLESIRLTSHELTELTDDVTTGVKNANRVAQQVDQGVSQVRQQAQQVQVGTRSVLAGIRAAWRTLSRPSSRSVRQQRSRQRLLGQVAREEAPSSANPADYEGDSSTFERPSTTSGVPSASAPATSSRSKLAKVGSVSVPSFKETIRPDASLSETDPLE